MMALYVDSRSHCLGVELIYRGTVNTALVATRDIIRSAVVLNATGFVLSHLHPSGDPSPSGEDLEFTAKLKRAAELVNLEFHDHLVLGFDAAGRVRHTSLRERGWM
jgi:DNA repair protein RadC